MQSNNPQSPLPSVEELFARTPNLSVWPTVVFLRARMTIPGALESAVVEVDEPHDPDSSFVPYQTLDNGTPVKHPISEEPVTYPAASSFTTKVRQFRDGPMIWSVTQHIDVESDCDEEGRLMYDYLMMHEDTIRMVTYTDAIQDYPEAGKLEVCKVTYHSCGLREGKEGEAARMNGLTADYMAKVNRVTSEAGENSGI
ncbi:hypothetical protein B0T11DRAFT_295144 [Plectosphaerella cucumerina]|uniref:Uncharacterized protein n=1 Tax=Plectosphaerella cucumerina TaxID=40658 RepID=A0A8K0X4Z4_9PEZI|nr:hypothetical protein B0T11DRAFT_295144 [Plectosphaerella cucumerina]